MISVIAATDRYILQPTLIAKHKRTLEWLSNAVLWKRELAFFQKLLDQYAPKFSATEDKKLIDHFQNLILYYRNELIDAQSTKLRLHEKKLAQMLEQNDETNTGYFKEHDDVIAEMDALHTRFHELKQSLFQFIERAM